MTGRRDRNPLEDTTRTLDPPPVGENEANHAYLVVLAGSSVGEMFRIEKPRTVLGRGERADVRLVDEGISREHAELVREGEQVFLRDLGSTNGTFCNGVRVDRQLLEDGDKILLGSNTIVKFSYHDRIDEAFQRQMAESALRDGLTRAFNKRYFAERLESEFVHATRHKTPLVLVFLDIDHFKKINDQYGHPAGDAVLSELASVVSSSLRIEDVFARFGGEEFAIISRGADLAEGRVQAERLRAAVADHRFEFEGKVIPVTISVGVARAPDPAVQTSSDLIAVADETMYEAKRSGRNRVCVRDPGVSSSAAAGG